MELNTHNLRWLASRLAHGGSLSRDEMFAIETALRTMADERCPKKAPSKSNARNSNGVKWQSDSYRTIDGEHYIAWMSYPSEDRIKAYRAPKIRCRRFGDELYIHHEDQDSATEIDRLAD